MVQSSISFRFQVGKKIRCVTTLLVDDQNKNPSLQILRDIRADQTEKKVVYLNQLQV